MKRAKSIFPNQKDNDVNDKFLNSLNNFNLFDIILRVSALNLLPYNQNKSLVLDKIINDILTYGFDSYNSENLMSMSKFRNLINQYMNSGLALSIDPAEMPFIQRVQFYGDYWILTGINTNIGYNLQSLIYVLFNHENEFNKEFLDKCNRMTHSILTITNDIVTSLGYGIETLDHYERTDVDIPSSDKLTKLSDSLIVNIEFITTILQDDADILFYNYDNHSDFSKYESENNFLFFYSPLLKINEKEAIILDPTMLPTFLIYYILKQAKEYDLFQDVINEYNNEIWKKCRKYLKNLEIYKIDETAEGVELVNNENYKESVFCLSNSKLLFVRFFCDDGSNYNCNEMFSFVSNNTQPNSSRWDYMQKSFDKCSPEDFYSLNIINTFGRGLSIGLTKSQSKKSMQLSPFELECVSINEREHSNFITRYIDSKSRIHGFTAFFGDIDAIAIFTHNNYSFYYNDDINIYETTFYPGLGEGVDYLNNALQKENRQLLDFPQSRYLKEIVLSSDVRQIYYNPSPKSVEYVVRFTNVDFWVCGSFPDSIGMFNMVNSVLDLITYWLSEIKPVIENLSFCYESIVIMNTINEEIQEYFSGRENTDSNIADDLSFQLNEEILNISWTQQAFHNLAADDNSKEKDLLCKILTHLSPCYNKELNITDIDQFFGNPLKKKLFSINISDTPYFKPTYSKARTIPIEYENVLLDEIGQFALTKKGFHYGIISNDKKASLCQDIVSFLYEKLKEKVACLDGRILCKLCYRDLEKVIYDAMIAQKRYSFDSACYPEKSEMIFKSFSENNRVSTSLKFLIEYVVATQPDEKKNFDEIEYENILTICSFINDWAYNGDLFKYKIIDSKVEMLKSNRIGIDKTKIQNVTNHQQKSYNTHLSAHSNPGIDTFSLKNSADYIPDLDEAFIDEYGYSFSQLYNFVYALIDEGNKINTEVKIVKFDEVINAIEQTTDLSSEIIKMIIRDLSLGKRNNYLTPPDGFSPNDIWPWRFNRRLSFTRRPLIIYEDELIWGNRQLSHSFWFTVDLIFDGKYKATKKKLKSLIGKIANKRGNAFNDDVKQKLLSIDSFTVDSKVKKINGKWIASEDNNTLGDIDILIINHKKHCIIVGEVKDFSFTKNAYEMYQEYQSVFCDNDSKLCYISKHKRRVKWVEEHISDVIMQYNLPKANWTVRDVLITNDVIVSNEIYHKKQKILLYSQINKKSIMNL